MVLVDNIHGYILAEILSIKEKADTTAYTNVTKEVICKVDPEPFKRRKANRAKADRLKKEMDEKVKEIQEWILIELMAEKDEDTKDLLESIII